MKADGSIVINGSEINISASGTVSIKGKDIQNN